MSSLAEDRSSRRTLVALAVTVGGLAAYNLLRALVVPGWAQVPANLAAALAVLAIARWASCTSSELGLARSEWGRGARLGGLAALVVAVVVVAAAVVSSSTGTFADALTDDRADVGVAGLLVQLVVSIALGTVVLEELAFRGSLLALLRRRAADRTAVVLSSLLFGTWHLAGAVGSSGDNAATEDVSLALVLAGTFAATAAAGVVLCWLRLRSRSLVAPALAHLSLNASAFLVAWIAAR